MHVRSPGRVNLIGDHTDYTGGLVLPMAIDRATVFDGEIAADIHLISDHEVEPASMTLVVDDPAMVRPPWARYVAGVVAEMSPGHGVHGSISSDIPVGAGLSSSASLEIAVALALGFAGSPVELAELCRRAEFRASGVPCGIMDQLAIAAGVDGHAVLIDCHELTVSPVPIPDGVEVVVQFIAHRTLVGSAYADRVAECAAAEREIGPLRLASPELAATVADPVARRRALHVTTENRRVADFAAALGAGDLAGAGALMVDSHRSLAAQFETSTGQMDAAVAALCATPGVYGARMTGGGFGGCVVALAEAGALADGWVVKPVAGAQRIG